MEQKRVRGGAPPGPEDAEANYADCLLTALVVGTRVSARLVSGEPLPDLSDFTAKPEELGQLAARPSDRRELDADKVINIILRAAGWRAHTLFKTRGTLSVRLRASGGGPARVWKCGVTLSRGERGRRQLLIER